MKQEKAKFDEAKKEAAEKSINRNMYELNEADARVRHFKLGADWAKSYLKAEEEKRKCVDCRYFTVINYNKYKACEIINIDLAETNINPQSFNCKMFERKE